MAYFAYKASSFTGGDLSGWKDCVENVDTMEYMFEGSAFTGNVSGWQLNSLTNMQRMFYNRIGYSAEVGDWWIGNVQNMFQAFVGANITADLSNWDGKTRIVLYSCTKYCIV